MQAENLSHHYQSNTALPYFPNSSVTSKDIQFIAGTNVLTSIKEYAERRPGFPAYLADTSFTFSGSIQRMFTWRRWTGASVTLSGSFFVMYSVITSTASVVYKQRVGTDALPVWLHQDSTQTAIPFEYCLSNDFVFFGDGTDMMKWDGTTKTNWGITGPAAAVTFSSGVGSLSPVVGYQWLIAWENSSTGHISSPAPASISSVPATNVKYTFTGNTTSDAQVDKVRLFRTVDGGSIYFELPASPISYATWIASGYEDNTPDPPQTSTTAVLTAQVAPLPNQNNRPTGSRDPIWFANRIWTHTNDTVYYSDFEELVRGVEEEAFAQINYRFFGREIIAKRVAGTYLLIYTADVIYRIYGDSLATFRMDTLAEGKGALNPACVIAFNGLVAWLDSSNTVWVTDGISIVDIDLSFPIRSAIASVTPSSCAMAYHNTGNQRWLILMVGSGDAALYVYDLDTRQWMPPWMITGVTALYSGQTAAGTVKLFLGRSQKPLVLGTAYQDDGASYTASFTTNLFDMVPYGDPSAYGVLDHVAIETGSVPAYEVKYLTDEDPSGATYTPTVVGVDAPNRTQGTNLVETWYMTISDPNFKGCRRCSIQVLWSAQNANFKIFGMDLAYESKE